MRRRRLREENEWIKPGWPRGWEYTLKCGLELRKAIEDEDAKKVLSLIDKAYKELLNQGIIDDTEYSSYTDDFTLYSPDDEDFEENVDYELENLYDLCDYSRVWIPLQESRRPVRRSKRLSESRRRRYNK